MKNFTASLRTLVGEYIINTCTPNSKQKKKPSAGLKNHARGKFSNFWYFFIVPLIFASYLSDAQVNPLTPIQGFNVFSYGNATVNSGDFNGGLAVSGNLTTKGAFSLAMSSTGTFKASGDANNTVLIVEGNVNYQAGSGINVLSNGFVKIKDFSTSKYWATNPTRLTSSSASSQDANPRINLSTTQTQASINADVFDFNGTIATLRSYSDTYKNCSSNTTVSTSVNSYTFNVTAGRTNFYKISAATLANFNEIKFSIVPSATNPVVITVDLGSLTTYNWNIPNFPGVPNAAGQYILFNFVNGSTTTVNLNGGGTIIGTVFAPYSHVAKLGSGNIEGQIVCLNYNHDQGEVHYQPFGTTLNCSTYSSVTCDCPGGLLLNSGFELQENRAGYDASYKTRNWEWNSEATLTTGSGFEVCDANNAYLYAKSSGAAMWQKVNNITEGTAYTLSAYGGTHEPGYNHRYRLAFYNSAGTLLSFVEAQVDWDVDIVPAGQPKLKEYVLNGVAPIGTSYLRVEGYASGDWLKLDNLCLTVNNTCNNLTSGGTIGANQVLCKNVSSTPAKIANVTLPSGGDTGQGISYQWYRATSLENGACPTNVSGSNKYTAISGATSSEYTPGAITQTTCYIRTAKRANCSDFVAESNAVLVVLKNNCTVTPCANNLVTNASFETDDNGTYGGKKFPVYFQSSPASYITRTSTNTDIYRGASPTNWSIGTNVNDYANQNGAYYIDASVTGNANSGDRFIYGRYNQCVVFSNNSNQVFLPVTPGKKYTICAYMAAFNPSGVQGNADVYFEYKFRNGNDGSQGILSSGEILKVVPADTDGKWETLGWQQYCVEITAPLGASYLEFYITPRDEEGDGVGIDDVCLTETDCTPAPTVSSAAICGTGTSTFTATGCTGGTVKWYSSLSSTTPLATGASYTPTSKSNSFSLFATCTLNSCESIRQAVSLTVNGSVSGVTATASGGNTSACGVPIQINGTGSVANPNLVYNGDFSAGNVGFTTNYGNQNNGYGVYGIVTNANSYFNWASACQDRTAAGTGNIFVADGGVTASLTVWSQRIVVNPNTTYRLSAWASSISSTLPSQLALYINGTKVGTTATLSATTCLWQQLTTTWNSGTNTAITLEIRNENTNSGGNDFALDDISMTVETPSVSYSWSGPGGFTSSSQNISASTTGTYTLTVSGNNGCSSSASIAVTVNPTPSTPIVTPSARCGTGIVALGATCGAGEVAQWYASQTSTVVLATGTSYSPNISTTTTYYVACKNTTSNCETPTGSRQGVIGTVNPIPSSPSSGNVTNGSICGAGVVSLGASCGAGEVAQWYASQTSTVVLATGTSYSPNISTTTTYYVGCKDNTTGCETPTGSRQGVIGTVNPIPSSPSSGNVTNGSRCGTGVVSLGASCGVGETVQWYASQTSTVVLATGTSYSPNISTTTTYYVACKNTTSDCETPTGSRQGVIGTVNPIPSSPSSGNVTNGSRCGTGVVSLGASCGVGETVQWYASQTSTVVLATGTSYSPNISTTTTYYVACKNTTSNCETPTGSRQSVIGTVNPIPSSPSSGNVTNGSICGAGVVSLGASCGAGEVVQWYASQTSTVVLATGTSYSPNISTTTTYYVACKNTTSNCETPTGSRQSVIGTVNPIPSSPSSSNVQGGSVCGTGSLTLTANCNDANLTSVWYSSQTSTAVLATGNTYTVAVTANATYYVACKNIASSCETPTGSRQSVIGTVNPIPSSPSSGNVTNGSICGAGVVSLGASCGAGEVVQWYASQTSTVVLATGTSYSPNISTTTTYYVACKNTTSNCETSTGSRQGVIGTVNPIPSSPSSGNVTNGSICGAGVVSLGASCGAGEVAQWYASQTSTVVLATGTSYSPNISTTTTYYVACKNTTSNCETPTGSRQGVIGTVNPIPSSPSSGNVTNGSICGAGVVSLGASCGAGEVAQWYASQTSTVVLATGTSYSPNISTTTTYYVGCKDNSTNCETPTGSRRGVTGTINPNLPSPSSSDVQGGSVCSTGVVSLSAVCSGGQTVQWYASQTSTAVLATGTSYSPNISTTTTYYVGCKDNTTGCETPTGSRQGVIGTVNPIPSAPVAGNITNGSICGAGVVSLGASCGVGETVQWYASQTSTVVLATGTSYSPNISTTTTYYVACKNTTSNCETSTGSRQGVIGTVNPIPSSPSSSNVQGGSVCGTGSLTLTANCNDANLTSVWYSSQTSTAVLATGNTYTVAVTANATYYVACKNIASSCETPAGNRRAVEVIYNDKPAPVAIGNSPICVGGTLNLSTSGGTTYSWDGPNGFNSTSATPVITNVALATSGIYTVTVAGAGGCAGTATVEVMVKAKPTVTATVIDGTVCTNSSILLNAAGTPAIGSTIASYDWTGPSTFASTSQNPTIPNAVEANEGFYTVKATDSFGCTATSQVFVWINPLPSATASSEGGNIICQGAPISLYANGAGIGGSYVWTGPAGSGFSSTIQNPTINNASPIHVGVYTVNITDANGCAAATTISITLDKCLRLGDLVWNDLNNNGIKDNGESGIAGVTVKLYRDTNNDGTPDGSALDTKITSSTGNYLFVGLEPDNYLVAIIAPAGYVSSTGKNGNTTGPYEGIDTPDPDDDINDDDNGSTVGLEIITKPVTLINFSEPTNDGDSDNNSNLTVDFGLFKPSKIGDYVWYDIDRDGIQNGTLTGVSGMKVTLTDALGNELATTTTSSTGYYLFDNLGLGDYKVVFDKTTLPPAYVFSPQNAGGDSTKDSDVDTDGKTGVISITVPGTINLTIDAGINCPAPNIAISADKNSYCAGSQIQLSTVVTGSPTLASYSWVGPAGFTSSVQNPVIASASTTQGGVYTLTVTANNACAATATATVNVVVYAQPTVAATVVTSQVCKGGIIELKGNGSGNSYGWSGPAGFSSTQQNPTITNVDEINEGVYTLTVKDGNICSASATVNVIVNPLPTVTATGGVVCAGLSTNLNAQGATSYAWSGPNGFTATGASPSVNIQGIYTVVGTNTNGCTATATASLTVNPAATITASNIEVCVGGVAKLVATGGSNYAWSGPNGFSSTIAEPIVANSASTSLSGVYTVVATTSLGCIGSATATLTVKENPVVTILGNTVICPAGQVTLSTNATGIYSWSGPNSFTATTSSVNVSNPGTYQVSVTNNGCSAVGTIALTTETFSLAAFASPNITCTGGTINLRVNATVGSGIKSYAWSGPAGFTSTQATPTLNNVVVASSGVYTVSVEGNSGCASTATVNVTVQPIPTVNNTVGFCQGSKAVLSVNNYTSYLWNTGSTASSIEVTNSGIYTVTVIDINGCISFGSFNVTENPKPTATITGATAFCSYTSTDLTINSGVSGQTYSWTGPNGFSSTSQTITATEAGNYVVKVISDKGCEATTSVSVTKNTTTATATGGSTCEEGSITLTATGGTSYSWTGPNGFTSTAQNPQLTHLPKAGQGVYEVTVNNNGCTATATSSVTVYEKPVFVPVLANSTCNNNTPANNGYIKIIGFDTINKYDIVEGSTYTGGKTFANATVIPSNGMLLSNITNPTTDKTYTIRVFNTNNCFTDKTVTIQAVTCECGPLICIPIAIQRIGR